jgi:hypothetical protein
MMPHIDHDPMCETRLCSAPDITCDCGADATNAALDRQAAVIMAMVAGPALNLLVAEKVMGWTWIQPPQFDYDGPLPEQGKILAPPGWSDAGWTWPPRGVIPADFFLRKCFSSNIAHAWEVMARVTGPRLPCHPNGLRPGTLFMRWWRDANLWAESADDAALAICRAALIAVGAVP